MKIVHHHATQVLFTNKDKIVLTAVATVEEIWPQKSVRISEKQMLVESGTTEELSRFELEFSEFSFAQKQEEVDAIIAHLRVIEDAGFMALDVKYQIDFEKTVVDCFHRGWRELDNSHALFWYTLHFFNNVIHVSDHQL